MTALLVTLLIGPRMIDWLRKKQKKGQPIREEGPKHHIIKKGTPTMGGLLILLAMVVSTLLWADLTSEFVWVVLFITCSFGFIGFADDYLKVTKQSSDGVSGRIRLFVEFAFAFGAVVWMQSLMGADLASKVNIPFLKDVAIDLGWFFVVFAGIVIVGTSNAVNLTDGLDGLAIVPVMIAIASFALIAYLTSNEIFSSYLQINFVRGTDELVILCGAVIGAGLGFLWFNAPPAMVFMGDTGSLSLGGALGTISVATKHELVLVIIGGLFVLELVSVVVQVASFQLTGKRVFRMAPIHHHFEQQGWSEPTIVIRFWIIAFVLALIGLTTLKLR